MATRKQQVEAWIDQANSDIKAARAQASGIAECHRRYWIQQSYEKAIKAYALMRWTGKPNEEQEFARVFLRQHSPLKNMSSAAAGTPLSKPLYGLQRELESFVRGLDQYETLLKIDATTPTFNPDEISYRYPFRHEGAYLSPTEFGDWDRYQGNFAGAIAAVTRLIAAVEKEVAAFYRSPK